jgi:Domain of unknown function (DUF3786)
VLGEAQAWERLAGCDPADVCLRGGVEYSPDVGYSVPVFGFPILADPKTQAFTPSGPASEFVLSKTAYFARLSILHYLLGAQRLTPTGRLLAPAELKTGQFFLSGSHALPLEPVASRFASDPEEFLAQGARFRGEPRPYGDASVQLLPFPRVPIVLILWLEDDEFPARSSLLFDEICEPQLPADILWSVAMMCALAMLRG